MEPLGSYSSSSSASSTTKYLSQTIQPTKGSTSNSKQLPHHHSSLHSVQKSSSKPWKKPAVAPLPPTPQRIYKVDPINFRELVQRLTCAPEFMETRSLQSVAPPPIDIRVSSVPNHVHSSPEIGSPFSVMYKDLLDTLELSPKPRHQKRLNWQSPSSHHWFSFPLLSPGTLSSITLE
ncbi:hypothetical protein D8674_040969 [Pyrus ussuriensis x Pyrus communis]|uniref:VQ domain-containing protein n=1 Tax=Pyrus ussuriensis x Pyrus communis TaxID=2448454 RepID=A0A5N5FLL1_9ROSA|nr:hypothetical protein D8674_040969 [Pyrus ussuriensis x Pyrus communis]